MDFDPSCLLRMSKDECRKRAAMHVALNAVIISVFTDLSRKHSSATINRAVLGIVHSRGHNSGLFSRPL